MTTARRYSDLSLYRRALLQARPYWIHIVGIFLLSVLSTGLALLAPVPLKIAVDSVIGSQPLPGVLGPYLRAVPAGSSAGVLAAAAGMVVAIGVLGQLRGLADWLLGTYVGEKLALEFRVRLFRHAQRISLAYHDTRGTTDALYRIQYDAPAVQSIAIIGVVPFVTAALTLASMLFVMFRLDWQISVVALAVSPVIILLSREYNPRLKERWREQMRLASSAMSVVQEALGALRVVKAFGQEDREEDRFAQRSAETLRASVRVALYEGSFDLAIGVLTAVGTATVLYIGVQHVQSGVLSLGELLLVMSYLGQLYGPLQTIGKQAARLQRSLAGAERAYSLLDEAPDVSERPGAKRLGRASGSISFEDVSFAYDGSSPVLRNVSFSVAPGTRVGIAGVTGAGKTTLVNLLARFYDPTAGQILLDGVDIRDYSLVDLRNQFAIVLQEPILFSTSIRENIAYGRPEATDREIVVAARTAGAHDFIVSLSDGYDTMVGERGMRLSGGERQRIALARAFLKDAPILILDEPTSSVDVKTEAGIMEAMDSLARGRTTILIAHRLSTLLGCDVLLTMGRSGTVELMVVGEMSGAELAAEAATLLSTTTGKTGA
jgi:ATP-binding cassette subfamily B protein